MFTKIAHVVAFCDREVQFWRVVAAYTRFSHMKKGKVALFSCFLLRLLLNFFIVCVFREGNLRFAPLCSALLRCFVLWRAVGRRAEPFKCRKVSFPLIGFKPCSTGSIGGDGVE